MDMKKFIVGGIVVVLLGGYALWSASRSQTAAMPVTTDQTGVPIDTGTSSTTTTVTTTTTTTKNTYKDGTYTGSVGDAAPYGQVQVSVTISSGKIASIKMLQSPSGPGETNQISARAFPILIQEAITAQTSKVNIVSGATQDSQGFQQSLGSALVQAQA